MEVVTDDELTAIEQVIEAYGNATDRESAVALSGLLTISNLERLVFTVRQQRAKVPTCGVCGGLYIKWRQKRKKGG